MDAMRDPDYGSRPFRPISLPVPSVSIPPHDPTPQPLLLVDDDLILLDTLREFLANEGFAVTVAASGEEAEDLLAGAAPPFDLVLTDLVMPGKTGMDVLKSALKWNPGCTVLVLSGYGTVREATEAMEKGAFGMVSKPLQLEAFRQTLRRILERTRLIRERDQLTKRVAELEERNARLEAIQGRMEMLAQRMAPSGPRVDRLQVLKDLRARGILEPATFEAAWKAVLAEGKP
jgi:DNA-binding NtrC family response regulator